MQDLSSENLRWRGGRVNYLYVGRIARYLLVCTYA
jgi:hypothetical protein